MSNIDIYCGLFKLIYVFLKTIIKLPLRHQVLARAVFIGVFTVLFLVIFYNNKKCASNILIVKNICSIMCSFATLDCV